MDELLDEQARFFASKNLPAASASRRKDHPENVSPPAAATEPRPVRPISKFAASREKQATAQNYDSGPRGFAEPMSLVSLNIVERNARSVLATF
jgi:hypothetical protein